MSLSAKQHSVNRLVPIFFLCGIKPRWKKTFLGELMHSANCNVPRIVLFKEHDKDCRLVKFILSENSMKFLVIIWEKKQVKSECHKKFLVN